MARNRNGRFNATYRDRNGDVQTTPTFSTAKEADARAKACRAIEAQGRDAKEFFAEKSGANVLPTTERRGHITVEGYGPGFLAGHRLEETSRESYGCMLKHVYAGLGTVPVRDLDAPKVRQFIRALEAKPRMSGATVGHVMTVLREMCRTAVQDGTLARDPTAGIKIADRQAREMTILTQEQATALKLAIQPHFRLLLRTLLSTGLRWGEAIALRPSDVIQADGQWVIKVSRTIIEVGGKQTERNYGKTVRAMRYVAIDAALAEALRFAAERNGHIFTAARGGKLTRANFRRVWLLACKAAGVEGVRVHDCRHTHASWMANAPGADLSDLIRLSKRLGHADLKTTSRYVHAVSRKEDEVLDVVLAMAA
jgi:integrase